MASVAVVAASTPLEALPDGQIRRLGGATRWTF
jgi:hypothetical protein